MTLFWADCPLSHSECFSFLICPAMNNPRFPNLSALFRNLPPSQTKTPLLSIYFSRKMSRWLLKFDFLPYELTLCLIFIAIRYFQILLCFHTSFSTSTNLFISSSLLSFYRGDSEDSTPFSYPNTSLVKLNSDHYSTFQGCQHGNQFSNNHLFCKQ